MNNVIRLAAAPLATAARASSPFLKEVAVEGAKAAAQAVTACIAITALGYAGYGIQQGYLAARRKASALRTAMASKEAGRSAEPAYYVPDAPDAA